MSKLVLQELLDSVGINKVTFAKLMDVSPKTVQRMGDNVSAEALTVIDKYKQTMTHEQSEAVPVPCATDNGSKETCPVDVNLGDYDVNSLNRPATSSMGQSSRPYFIRDSAIFSWVIAHTSD